MTIKMSDPSTNPDNWIFGTFYYNVNDKRLFVPKKNPYFGITLNFAKPGAYIFVLLFMVVVITLITIFPSKK